MALRKGIPSGFRLRRTLMPYGLLAPALSVIALIVLYPLARLVYMSLHFLVLTQPGTQFIGLANYVQVFKDEVFFGSLGRTAIWVAGSISLQFLLALALALMLSQRFRLRGVARVLALLPWVTPSVVSSIMWMWMFDANYGVVNDLLVRLHILDQPILWLGNPKRAMLSVIVSIVWRGTPFFAVCLLAALQAIPEELYEAAEVDGASSWDRFLHITIPMISPTILITLMLRTMWLANHVDTIFVMTGGGPGYATFMLPVYTYMKARASLDFGYASALSVIFSAVLMAVTGVYMYYLTSREAKV